MVKKLGEDISFVAKLLSNQWSIQRYWRSWAATAYMHKVCHSGSCCFTLMTLQTIFQWFLSSKCCSLSTSLCCCKQQSILSRANMWRIHPLLLQWRLWSICGASCIRALAAKVRQGVAEPVTKNHTVVVDLSKSWAIFVHSWTSWLNRLSSFCFFSGACYSAFLFTHLLCITIIRIIWSYVYLQPCRAMQSPWMHATIYHFL